MVNILAMDIMRINVNGLCVVARKTKYQMFNALFTATKNAKIILYKICKTDFLSATPYFEDDVYS
jgi:hypothetical protein